MKKKMSYLIISSLAIAMIASSIGLASTLGISSYAAKKVIDIIDAVSTVATIISLATAVIGAGAISAAIVATAKKMIKKYGKKYAAAW
ncbi:circular bacteriocin, circularin A/uberolysin family [Clostridium sp. DSM 8431]|uniref:uberolysin/carnocyclin family circular bacteriocin n=1 Tax=Clostridium sp. DSM 8431 TaxID=1761781 RepID=UPI0008E00518|nr:uberolysin/carnocyclin family circular bacteriocin [Clostridium sp. DSM 8431]SFU43940.1 circular bacteriocin, circularin A/uberolysin family [Clostridium sp. DSM 8431]